MKPYNCPTCLNRNRDDLCKYCVDESVYIRDDEKLDELLMYEQQGGVL